MAKFKGTDAADSYTLREGKRDVVTMLGGDDAVTLSAASFGSDDRVDAGEGRDTAVLDGGGFYNFGHDRFAGFESLVLDGAGRFEIYIDDSVVTAGETLSIASGPANGASLFIDGAPERDGSLLVHAGGGDDVLIGTGRPDTFYGGRGGDLMTGNEGDDTFVFEAWRKGDAWGRDRITDFHPGEDHLVFYSNSITSFDQLFLSKTRDGLVIRPPDSAGSILLYGVLPKDLHASDVTFLPMEHSGSVHALAIPHDGPLA